MLPVKKIGNYLNSLGFVSKNQVESAFSAQTIGKYPDLRLGDILIKRQQLTRGQLDQAIEQQMLDQFGMIY